MLAKEQDEKYLFTPGSATVSQGTTVTWTNKTDAEHSVTFDSGGNFDKEFEENESVKYTFDKAGTYRYHCKYHPYMKGTVVVKLGAESLLVRHPPPPSIGTTASLPASPPLTRFAWLSIAAAVLTITTKARQPVTVITHLELLDAPSSWQDTELD